MGSIQINDADKVGQQNFFVDREAQSKVFEENLAAVSNQGSQLIYYAGTGGVGKSALIKKLEKELQSKTKNLKYKFVSYDFTINTDMLTTLNAMKKFLVDNYKVEFFFFEKGCLSYYKKCGDESGKEQIKKILKEKALLGKFKEKIDKGTRYLYNARNVDKATGETIEELGYILEGMPMVRVAKVAVNLFDEYVVTRLQNSNLEYDLTYRQIEENLKNRENHISPEAIKEYLPTLFAIDISNWLNKNDLCLVIFLDTYEQLTGDETDIKPHKKLIYDTNDVPVDWWIEDLIRNTAARVLWVIAGRGKVKTIGKNIPINEEKHICTLTALDENSSKEFLNKSDIENETLRKDIIELTSGYPVYLAACASTYKEIISTGRVFDIEKFLDEREEVINRLLGFMDDNTKNIVKRLCILGRWTDFYAQKIFSLRYENNNATYSRVKNLSFVSAQNEKIFVFDRSIREILFKHLLKEESVFVDETRAAVDKFFKSVFYNANAEENKTITNEDRILLFNFWAEFILNAYTDENDWLKQYLSNLAPISGNFDDDVVEGVIAQFKNKIENKIKKEQTEEKANLPYSFFENLFAQIKFVQGNDKYALELAKKAYAKIKNPNIEKSKDYMTAGHYSLALFHAMKFANNPDEYENFCSNFKSAIKNMTLTEKENVLENYNLILKYLLSVYRKSNEVIAMIDKTMKLIDSDKDFLGESLNTFLINLNLYKLTALSHLGKVEEFSKIAAGCLPDIEKAIEQGDNINLYLIFINRQVVNFQNVFDYEASLKLGTEITKILERTPNFKIYEDQYCRICGSLASTYYFTLNKSHDNLERAREFAQTALNGFIKSEDKIRQYQTLAQIEAEVGNFERACEMLDKGINISFENLRAEDFKNFREYDWYHFAKFSERLLKSADEKYFEIAKRAIEIAKEEFLNYRNEIGNMPEHPHCVTFSKMGTCFDILGDTELAVQLHEDALSGVAAQIGEGQSATLAGYRLVIMANELLTLEKNNLTEKSATLKDQLKNYLEEYLEKVNIDSMKVPFAGWADLLNEIEKNPADKLSILEKMRRTILV